MAMQLKNLGRLNAAARDAINQQARTLAPAGPPAA